MYQVSTHTASALREQGFEPSALGVYHTPTTISFSRKSGNNALTQFIDLQPKALQRGSRVSFCVGAIHHALEKALFEYFAERTSMFEGRKKSLTYTLYGPVVYTDYELFEELKDPPAVPASIDRVIDRLTLIALAFHERVNSDSAVLTVLRDPLAGRALCANIYQWYFRFSYLTFLCDPASNLSFGDVSTPHGPATDAALDQPLARDIFENAREVALLGTSGTTASP